MGPSLRGLVRDGAAPVTSPMVNAVTELHKQEQGANLLGLLFYGSHLNRTAGTKSDHDFFAIVRSYREAHAKRRDAFINGVLPPNIYRRTVSLSGGETAKCKVSVVTAHDLTSATLPEASDCYIFGRLGKRVSLVYARNDTVRNEIHNALCRSVALCGGWALRGMEGPFARDTFILSALALSYRSEERVEGVGRAKRLFNADEAYFRAVYGTFLADACDRGLVRLRNGDGPYQVEGSHARRHAERQAYERFLRRSRTRARLRWIKNMWTFEDWADYMVTKIAHHQGISIKLSGWERRHPVFAALKHYIRLRREGRLR